MKDGVLEDFAGTLSGYLAQKPQPELKTTHLPVTPFQKTLNEHVIDIPFRFADLDLRLIKTEKVRKPLRAHAQEMVAVQFTCGDHSAEISLFASTLQALMAKTAASVDLQMLYSPIGHLVAEHLFSSMLGGLETHVRSQIAITAVKPGDSKKSAASKMTLVMLSESDDVPSTSLHLDGSDDVALLFSQTLAAQAPELEPRKPTRQSLTISLRSPVFAIDKVFASQIKPGDAILLDERFTGMDCCRVWGDEAFSAATEPEPFGTILMEEPVSESEATDGTHWFNTGVEGAAQIIFGSKLISSRKVERWAPEISVPFGRHDLKQARLEITGFPPFEGRLLSLDGQWAFLVRDTDG